MTTSHTSTFAPRLRPLAAALATLCVVSTALCDLPLTHAATPAPPIVVANCNDADFGSLRDAINTVDRNGIIDGTIDLTQLSCSTISLTTGALVIPSTTSSLEIDGPGQNKLTIDGGNSGAVLSHDATGTGTLKVKGISIINGNTSSNVIDPAGGCIHTNSNLELRDVSVSHCKASAGNGHLAYGGGVFAQRYATIVHSTISDSSVVANDSGRAGGGGLYAAGGLYLSYSTVADNVASSNVSLNSFGGGVVAKGLVRINNSIISTNRADEIGGLDLKDTLGIAATLINSTVSGNKAKVVGGVLAIPPLNLFNSTIAFNTSSVFVVGQQNFAAGLHILSSGQMESTIIANNVNSGAPVNFPTLDLTAQLPADLTGDHNNVMNVDTIDTLNGSFTSEDPGLQPLQDNGGPTHTHIPTPGLWDRFHGSNVRFQARDQRGVGFPRAPAQDPIEIGAFQTNSDIFFVNGFN